MRRLEADIDPANQVSARRLQRLGLQRAARALGVDGQVSDTAFRGLLAAEWLAARGRRNKR